MTMTSSEIEFSGPTASHRFLDVHDLTVHFPTDDGLVKAVDGVSFAVDQGKTLAIVGESGSGKSVPMQAVMGLHRGSRARMSGEVWLDGIEVLRAKAEGVQNALSVILMNPKVKGVLINVFGGITRADEVARGVVEARRNLDMKLPLVVRLSGTNEAEGKAILRENGIEPGDNGWEAAQKIVALTR